MAAVHVSGSSGGSPTVKRSNEATSVPVPLYAASPMPGLVSPVSGKPVPTSVQVAPSSSE